MQFTFRAAAHTDIPAVCRLRMAYLTEDLGEQTPQIRARIEAQLPAYG